MSCASPDEKKRILVVDDDRFNIQLLCDVLKSEYSILAAVNGASGLNIAKTKFPDLILLDVVMPDISGYEVITELKRNNATREIPVIFISAMTNERDEEKGLALGAADYVTKPFSIPIVRVRVKTQLQMAGYVRELKSCGLTDTLTGLPNRRSFDDRLTLEWNRAARQKEPLSVLMADLDHFKAFNDTHGHLQGDVLLQATAKALRNSVQRSTDFMARWGGVEFAVLLPNTDPQDAWIVAERIRLNIRNNQVRLPDGQSAAATVSLGINGEIPKPGRSIHDFLAAADEALYAAKRAGRDRIYPEKAEPA